MYGHDKPKDSKNIPTRINERLTTAANNCKNKKDDRKTGIIKLRNQKREEKQQ